MSLLKTLAYVLFFLAVFFGILYLRFGSSTVDFLLSLGTNILPGSQTPVSYQVTSTQTPTSATAGPHPLLFPGVRWGRMPITIFVDSSSCPSNILASLQDAAGQWQNDTGGTVSFSFVSSQNDGSVYVQCESHLSSPEQTQTQGTRIVETLGETRPTVVNTGLYNLTVSADVAFVLNSGRCSEPIVYLHELGHVLGLAHDNSTDSIMYAFEHCDQTITPDIVSTINQLYKDPALPDLYLTNVSAVHHGFYADFNLSIYNQGLIATSPTVAVISDSTVQLYFLNVPSLKPGSGWFFTLSNIPVTTEFTNVSISVDPKNEISELNKQNNVAFLTKQ